MSRESGGHFEDSFWPLFDRVSYSPLESVNFLHTFVSNGGKASPDVDRRRSCGVASAFSFQPSAWEGLKQATGDARQAAPPGGIPKADCYPPGAES